MSDERDRPGVALRHGLPLHEEDGGGVPRTAAGAALDARWKREQEEARERERLAPATGATFGEEITEDDDKEPVFRVPAAMLSDDDYEVEVIADAEALFQKLGIKW